MKMVKLFAGMMRIMITLMKNIKLTIEQKIDLEALHDASRDGHVRDRIKAVLLRSEGWDSDDCSSTTILLGEGKK